MKARAAMSIRWKLAGWVTVLLSVAVLVVGWAGYFSARNILRAQINARFTSVAAERQRALLDFIQRQTQVAGLLANRFVLRRWLSQKNGDYGSPPQQIAVLFREASRSIEGFSSAWILSSRGEVVVPNEIGLGEKPPDGWKAPDVALSAHLSVPQRNGGRLEAWLTAPVFSGDGGLAGYFVVLLSLQRIADLLQDTSGLGGTAEISFGTAQGGFVRMFLPSRFSQSMEEVPQASFPAMADALRGKQGFRRSLDYRGQEVLAAYRPVGYLDWGLVAKIDAQEADEPIRTLRRLLFGLQVGWLLIGGSLALLLAQRFASPIVQMVGGVKEIGRGNLGVRVPDGCADEIGELGRAFNQMADDLQNSRVRLEERVAERTGELARANSELQEALARVKTLSGLVPICTWCKKVRDDSGSWNQVEIYVERHSEAQFSHGVCPDCHEQLMADTQRPPESTQS